MKDHLAGKMSEVTNTNPKAAWVSGFGFMRAGGDLCRVRCW